MATESPGTAHGATWRDQIRSHPLSMARAASLALSLLDCLDGMDERGEIPYRLSPEDVLVDGEDRCHVVPTPASSEATRRADYVSPEVAAGLPVDRRAMAWQAGALLFELLVGEPPRQPSPAEEGGAIPSLIEARPDVPDAVACTIYRMLDPDPDLRLSDLAEARVAFEALGQRAAGSPSPGEAPFSRATMRVPSAHKPSSWETLFIGREQELSEIRRILTASTYRLVTVLGPGGVGKSRLAFHAAQALAGEFADGVCIVPLGTVISAVFVPMAIASALGVSLHGGQAPPVQLAAFLKDKRMLVVLDDFDRLIEGANLIARLLEATVGPRFLVTSRVRLNLAEEKLLPLEGLAMPDDPLDPEAGACDAVRLFMEHARRLGAGASIRDDDLPDVVRICRMLDGLPLGIEQAATWVRALPCEEIAEEIGRDLGFLSTTVRDALPQHRSIRAVFERSWRLLDDAQRHCLARLSVFSGGFRRDAASRVAGLDLGLLSQLIDRSLIQRSGPRRYRMHGLLRTYLHDTLEPLGIEPQGLLASHARWCAEFLAGQEKAIRGGDGEALAGVEAELDNIHAAWEWAVDEEATEVIQRLLRPLCTFLFLRAWFAIAEELCGSAARGLASLRRTDEQTRLLARLLAWQGASLFRLGERSKTRALLEESRRLQMDTGAKGDLALTLRYLALVANSQGDRAEAAALLDEALALCRKTDDRTMEAYVVGDMGIMATEAGDYVAALDHHLRSLALYRSEGIAAGIPSSLNMLGGVHRSLGDLERARAYFQESQEASRRIGNRRTELVAAASLCSLTLDNGELDEAMARAHEAMARARDLGQQDILAMCLCTLGNVHLGMDRGDEARQALEESLAIRTALGAHREAAVSRACLADALCLMGEFARACDLYHESLRVFEPDGNRWGVVACLRGLCHALISQRDLQGATELALRAAAFLKGTGDCTSELRVLEYFMRLCVARGSIRRAAEAWGCMSASIPTQRLGEEFWRIRAAIDAALPAAEVEEAVARGRIRSPESLLEELADEAAAGTWS